MGLEYLQIWADMEALFEPYDDAQRGRLIMAMMAYAYRGEEPEFTGVEKFIWPVLKQHIDRCTQSIEAKKAAGSKGGKSGKTEKQVQAEASRQKQNEAERSSVKQNESEVKQNAHTQYHDHEHDHNHNHVVEDAHARATAPAPVEPITGIDHTDLSEAMALNAEVDALLKRYKIAEYNRDALMDEIERHGLDKVKAAMQKAAESDNRGGLSIQFIRSVLANDGKPKPARAAPSATNDPHMQRYTPEERKATYSAAVLDFDE